MLSDYPFKQVDFAEEKMALQKKSWSGDCTVRALALATGTEWQQAYEVLLEEADLSAKGGAYFDQFVHHLRYAEHTYHGHIFKWIPFPAVKGQPRMNPVTFCREYPVGRYICRTARHVFAVIDGVLHDSWQQRPDRCIYGVWQVLKAETWN